MRRIIAVAAIILIPTTTLYAAELKVGHFELQRLIAQSDAGKESREKYMARAKNYQDELNSRTEKLKKLKEDIESEAKKLKGNKKLPPQLVEKNKGYASQFRESQRLQEAYKDELKVYDAELTRKVLEEFSSVLGAFATSNKYDYIFRLTDSFAFAGEKHDLTDELVKAFNKAHRK
ncbi:MAG: OmpH family outer membrane protein [Desulfuromonadaceae bacterium]|nr:OmpH family outer membrane protein [Desulfuromonadaceae bacterium]